MSQRIAERFKNFATLECHGSSDLYENLSNQIATDNELLDLSMYAREGQPIPNLLFGAVHYLLLQGEEHELKEFYPDIVDQVSREDNPFPFLKDFCMKNKDKIKAILGKKLVQTNEVRRCAYLYPVFCYIYNQIKRPLSLIEIGTSAGLQLLWDHYSYSYGDEQVFGNQNSTVHLTSMVRNGEIPYELLTSIPPVNDRLGIDLNITNLTDEDEYLWLKALIWPEHKERLKNLENAVKLLRITPPNLIEGDGVALLPKVIKEVPAHTAVCIFHTHVANQMPEAAKSELLDQVNEIGRNRDVFHIYNNIYDRKLRVDSIIDGKPQTQIIGDTDGHGRWFDWHITSNTLTP